MTRLNIVYQCCDLPGSQSQSLEQINRLLASDLSNEATVFLSLNGRLTEFLSLVRLVEGRSNFRICHTAETAELMEWPALNLVKDIAEATADEEYIMYFHLKGITHANHQGLQDWRRYMEYWTIDRWRDCIELLDQGYDTCGTNYIHGNFLGVDLKTRNWQHYSGGFWWARASYIRTLRRLPHPDSYVMGSVSDYTGYTIDRNTYRFDHEAWIASGPPRWSEVHSSPGGMSGYPGWHYHHTYPESKYRQT
jgi:hypothetical protein